MDKVTRARKILNKASALAENLAAEDHFLLAQTETRMYDVKKVSNKKRYPMDPLRNKQNFDLDKSRQKYHHSLKEHRKISKIPKFRCEML